MRWTLLFVCLLLPHLAPAAEADAIAEADRLYGLRASGDQADAAVAYLEQATADYPDSYGLHWRLARAAWWIADGTTHAETDQKMGKLGWDAGERAVALKSSGIEGHYWACLAMGEYAKGISIVKALAAGIDGKFNGHLDIVLASDEDYDNGGALRGKGMYWASLPRLMRKYDKSIDRLSRANELVPNHPRTLYYLADVHHRMGEDDKARDYLDQSLAATSWPDPPERSRVSTWARSLDDDLP